MVSMRVTVALAVMLVACTGSEGDGRESPASVEPTTIEGSTTAPLNDGGRGGEGTTSLSLRALMRRFDVGDANVGPWDQLVPRMYRPCANAGPETDRRVTVRQLRRDGMRVGFAISAAPGASAAVLVRAVFAACAGGEPDPMRKSGVRSWSASCGGDGEILGRWNNTVIPAPRVVVVSIGSGCSS